MKSIFTAMALCAMCLGALPASADDHTTTPDGTEEFRRLLCDSLSLGRHTYWTLPDSLEPDARMNFYLGTKGEKPEAGYPVFLYLHGSGPRDAEWATGLALAKRFADGPSMYIIPQIPQEAGWYRWYQRSKQWAWQRILRTVLSMPEVDKSRIYIFGISEGGYGSQRLASFYADYPQAQAPWQAANLSPTHRRRTWGTWRSAS